jgi:hypothetical protein
MKRIESNLAKGPRRGKADEVEAIEAETVEGDDEAEVEAA